MEPRSALVSSVLAHELAGCGGGAAESFASASALVSFTRAKISPGEGGDVVVSHQEGVHAVVVREPGAGELTALVTNVGGSPESIATELWGALEALSEERG